MAVAEVRVRPADSPWRRLRRALSHWMLPLYAMLAVLYLALPVLVMIAFSLSIDDYVITAFTAGPTTTFPLFIYGSQQRGIPVQVNVIGTIIFVTAVGFVLLSTIMGRRQRADPVNASTTTLQESE